MKVHAIIYISGACDLQELRLASSAGVCTCLLCIHSLFRQLRTEHRILLSLRVITAFSVAGHAALVAVHCLGHHFEQHHLHHEPASVQLDAELLGLN
jgi:hypothetical protein